MATITPQRQALEQQASSLIWGLVRANNLGTITDSQLSEAYAEVDKMLQGQAYNLPKSVLTNAYIAAAQHEHGINTAQAVDALDRALTLDK